MKKLVLLLSALLLALSLAAVAQEEQKEANAATAGKQERWEGMVVRASKDAWCKPRDSPPKLYPGGQTM